MYSKNVQDYKVALPLIKGLSYSSLFSSNTINEKLRTDIKIQCFQVQKNRYVHKFKLNIYHIH